MVKIEIITEYITLGQFLKFSGIINNGGEAKKYLETAEIYVNNEFETRRGKKLRHGDTIKVNNTVYYIENKSEN